MADTCDEMLRHITNEVVELIKTGTLVTDDDGRRFIVEPDSMRILREFV